ncbi:hypothetical protein IJ818_00930 [bacterium]|nr:hypothetical protein [bacterium]
MLFLISFLLVFSSSYFAASVLTKKTYEHFAYFLLISFAQIILTFELLSLFSAINVWNVLGINLLFWIGSLLCWLKRGKPLFLPEIGSFFRKYFNICKLDKSFIVLGICFFIFISGALFLNFVMPITNADAVDYHVSRSMFYILNGSLNHFDTADLRLLAFPFNSEIIYSWILLLLKKEAFLGFLSFFGYCLSIASVYKMMKLLGFSSRKVLWAIFVVSSLASVIVQVSSTETDILISSLILASIVLFWISFKENSFVNLFFASLSYAIAVGTKTTAIVAIPAVIFIMGFICFKNKNYKNFGYFSLFFVLNFLIFSSYSYILNFVDFGNFMGTKASFVAHKNFFGIRGMIANFIRHLFLFIDFSGFKWGEYIGKNILDLKLSILSFLHLSDIPDGIYNNPISTYTFNGTLIEPHMSFGILGFLIVIPCMIYSIVVSFFSKNFKQKFPAVLSISFIVFILTLSYLISFMNFNCRFLAMFVMIVSPIFVYSYFKKENLLKVLAVLCMIYYMVLVSSHLWARPWWLYAKKIFYENYSFSDVRLQAKCSNAYKNKGEIIDPFCDFWFKVRDSKTFYGKKILYFPSSSTNNFITSSLNYFYNVDIDTGLIYKIENYDLSKYDYLIFYGKSQYATLFFDKNLETDYNISDYHIDLEKKAPYYCFYFTRKGLINSSANDFSNLKDYPFSIECIVDLNYLKSRQFDFLAKYVSPSKDKNSEIEYFVYKNMAK